MHITFLLTIKIILSVLPVIDKASTNTEPIERDPKPTLTELMVLSAHNLFVDHKNYIVCSTCNSKCHNNDCQANRDFILSQCQSPFKFNANHFTPVNIPASLGHLKTHFTHTLHCYKGVFFCSVCGSFAQQKLVKLSSPCIKILSAHGKRVINALSNHKLPIPLTSWPDIAPPNAGISRGACAPLDPAVFLETPPTGFDVGDYGWLEEEEEAYESLTAQLFEYEADNFAKYHS